MKLEEKLGFLRKEKGLTQMELAEALSVSRQAVSKWETGAVIPSAENLITLSKMYGVSLDILIDDEQDIRHSAAPPPERAAEDAAASRPPTLPRPAVAAISILTVMVLVLSGLLAAALAEKAEPEPQTGEVIMMDDMNKEVPPEPAGTFYVGWERR